MSSGMMTVCQCERVQIWTCVPPSERMDLDLHGVRVCVCSCLCGYEVE